MNDTIKFWLEYAGGMDIVWLILSIFAATQLFKMLLKAFNKLSPNSVRPFPYFIGAALGLMFIDSTSHGAMIGVACGMLSSLLFFGASAWLERDASPAWQKRIVQRISLK